MDYEDELGIYLERGGDGLGTLNDHLNINSFEYLDKLISTFDTEYIQDGVVVSDDDSYLVYGGDGMVLEYS